MQIDLLDVVPDYVVTFRLKRCNQLSAHLNIPNTSSYYLFIIKFLFRMQNKVLNLSSAKPTANNIHYVP